MLLRWPSSAHLGLDEEIGCCPRVAPIPDESDEWINSGLLMIFAVVDGSG